MPFQTALAVSRSLQALGACKDLWAGSRLFVGLRSVTLSRDGAGRYFAAICADGVVLAEPPAARTHAVGIDVGLRTLVVMHDGEQARAIPAPKALSGKLARLRR